MLFQTIGLTGAPKRTAPAQPHLVVVEINLEQEFAGLRRGEERSFRRIFDAYFPRILTYCKRLLRLEHLAEEAAEDVFIQLWHKRRRLEAAGNGQALLYKIARDTSYTYLRRIAREERYRQGLIDQLRREATPAEALPNLLREEESSAIRTMIETLPPRRRQIFKMHFFEGADNGTIAERLSLSPNTVKAQLVKARAYLRGKISQELGPGVVVLLLLM